MKSFIQRVFIVTCLLLLLLALLLPGTGSQHDRRRTSCKTHLKRIGLALHNYHEVHGYFFPAYIADENGKPMHSWRVLILPYLGEDELYDQYNFDGNRSHSDGDIVLDSFSTDCLFCDTFCMSHDTDKLLVTAVYWNSFRLKPWRLFRFCWRGSRSLSAGSG
jgi:hypothetical protein